MEQSETLKKMTAKLSVLKLLGIISEDIYEKCQSDVTKAQIVIEKEGKYPDEKAEFITKNDKMLDTCIALAKPILDGTTMEALITGLLDSEKTLNEAVAGVVSKLDPKEYEAMCTNLPPGVLESFGIERDKSKMN